jgi:hypothetical protein
VNAPKPPPASYTHTQALPSTTWNVTHGLNRAVAVTVLDVTGEEITGTVAHVDQNTVRVTFNIAVSGRAVLT